MVWILKNTWTPQRLLEVGDSVDTSTGATEVFTGAGRAYIKPMGNRQGPHVLATDWVGTHLAEWFGLSTFDIAILMLGADDSFRLPQGCYAQQGPAFAAKALNGESWGISDIHLDLLVNPEDISRLVVFDTWTLNCDRHDAGQNRRKPNRDNVYLSSEGVKPGKRRLIAMDHGLCFIRSGEDLSARLGHIDKVQDANIYGLFPEFRDRLQDDVIDKCLCRLQELERETVEVIIRTVPAEWEVSSEARAAWARLILDRAKFVANNFQKWIDSALGHPRLF